MADLIEAGETDFGYLGIICKPLGDEETRQIIREVMIDPEGNPRLIAVEILSRAYARYGDYQGWLAFLEQKTAAPELSNDIQAQWMVCRGVAASFAVVPASPLRGKVWLDRALATANSPQCRVAVLSELVSAYADGGKYDTGLSLLDSLSEQFVGTDAEPGIEALRHKISHIKMKLTSKQHKYEDSHSRRVKKARKRELQKRLAKAQQRGDQETVQRMQKMLAIQ